MLIFGLLASAANAANVRYVDRIIEPESEPEPRIQYVDRFIEAVQPRTNCSWLNWGAWDECTGLCGHGQQKNSNIVSVVFSVKPAVVLATMLTTNPLQSYPKLDLLDTLVTFLTIPKLPLVALSNAATSFME